MILTMTYNQLLNFMMVCFFLSGILIVCAGVMTADELSKRVGEPTLWEWFKGLFKREKIQKQLPNEYILLKNFIKEFSSETPPSPGPYSGSEWSISDPSLSSSPTQTEAPSLDSAGSCNAAASSSTVNF